MVESSLQGKKTLWEKEIAFYEEFLFPECFQKTRTADK